MTNHHRILVTLAGSGLLALGTLAASAMAQTTPDARSAGMDNAAPVRGDADGAFNGSAMFGEQTGEALYANVCASCHMDDGRGAEGAGHYPALAANGKLAAKGYPAYVVVNGLNAMPALGQMMTDEQVAQVVNYVRTHMGNSYDDAMQPADVQALR